MGVFSKLGMRRDRLDHSGPRERRWRGSDRLEGGSRPARSLVAALLLGCASLMTLDYQGGSGSPVEPVRRAVGEVFGPIEVGTAAVVRPLAAAPQWFRSHDTLRRDLDALEAENAELRSQVRVSGYDRNKLAEFEGLTASAENLGYALVPARVVGLGPSQSFSRTVTIDAGSGSGISPDMTVVNNDGLVGRVLRVTRTTATVLLVLDPDSVVGGRVGESMEVGFLSGSGLTGGDDLLNLELIDESVVPGKDDTVVTWGSEGGAPYVSGVPIGRVTAVFSSLRETSQRAVIEPFVNFGALDVVGVVVASGTSSDRAVIEADGSVQ